MHKMSNILMWKEDFATLLELENPATILILRNVCNKIQNQDLLQIWEDRYHGPVHISQEEDQGREDLWC